jgi:hypothetical protein
MKRGDFSGFFFTVAGRNFGEAKVRIYICKMSIIKPEKVEN